MDVACTRDRVPCCSGISIRVDKYFWYATISFFFFFCQRLVVLSDFPPHYWGMSFCPNVPGWGARRQDKRAATVLEEGSTMTLWLLLVSGCHAQAAYLHAWTRRQVFFGMPIPQKRSVPFLITGTVAAAELPAPASSSSQKRAPAGVVDKPTITVNLEKVVMPP